MVYKVLCCFPRSDSLSLLIITTHSATKWHNGVRTSDARSISACTSQRHHLITVKKLPVTSATVSYELAHCYVCFAIRKERRAILFFPMLVHTLVRENQDVLINMVVFSASKPCLNYAADEFFDPLAGKKGKGRLG